MKPLVRALIAAVLLVPLAVWAGNTQVSPSSLRSAGKTGSIYGRSDGVFQDSVTGSPIAVENGQRIQVLGAGYKETFAYGAAKGITQLDQSGGGACAANTVGVPCLTTLGSGVKLVWFPVVTATLELAQVATGLDISGDLVDNDGNELVGGVLGASGRPFVIGDDPAFYFCATVKITDVDGTDELQWGFRRAEAANAVFDNYKDLAAIGDISGDIKISTILNDAATSTTDTTDNWADLETHKLCVLVSGTGVVTYTEDGAAPTVTAAFTFDDGDPVIPFMHLRHDANVAESTIVTAWEVGYTQP